MRAEKQSRPMRPTVWAPCGTRVGALCPGMTLGDLSKADRENDPAMLVERAHSVPLDRGARREDHAGVIHFLASKDAIRVHGSVLTADGGNVAPPSGHITPRGGAH